MSETLVLIAIVVYLGLLLILAHKADRMASSGSNLAAHPLVQSLAIAVYCTSWTYYGSVGFVAQHGLDVLAVYLGPIVVFVLGVPLLRKIHRLCKEQQITTIADFISARYGKSATLARMVTLVAVLGIMPYITLQLKAVSTSFDLIIHYPRLTLSGEMQNISILHDSAFYIMFFLMFFTILYGTNRISTTEQHHGLITVVAFESLVKLAAFMAVGLFVAYGLFDSPEDIFSQALSYPLLAKLMDLPKSLSSTHFWSIMLLSMGAIISLPRQFQVTFVESVNETNFRRITWMFPLYLVLINLFLLPIALAGNLLLADQGINPDTYVLALPMFGEQPLLTLLVFLGGISAASGMVIIETIALSTMIANDLILPKLITNHKGKDLVWLIKGVRRFGIVFILLLSYAYLRLIGDSYALVSMGLVSFSAAMQFIPALVVGIYWRGANRTGAMLGLGAGFVIWLYTLLLPSFMRSGWLDDTLLHQGLFGWTLLKPQALFGLTGLDPISHCLMISMIFNLGGLILGSLFTRSVEEDASQAAIFTQGGQPVVKTYPALMAGGMTIGNLHTLMGRFLEPHTVKHSFNDFLNGYRPESSPHHPVDSHLLAFAERLLAGTLGAASSRVILTAAIRGAGMEIDRLLAVLDDASSAIQTNQDLLRHAVNNIRQGILMLDGEMRLLVWNKRFLVLMNLPEDLVVRGHDVDKVWTVLHQRGEWDNESSSDPLSQRAMRLATRIGFVHEWSQPTGSVIEEQGTPLENGGWVITYTDITHRKKTESMLRGMNETLEQQVEERTQDLRHSLKALKHAQEQLVQSEKMSALGGLVAGVAHEINTPVGVAYTTITHLEQKNKDLLKLLQSHQLTQAMLEEHIDLSLESTALISSNLLRVGDLVRTFKKVAGDQENKKLTTFHLRATLFEIIASLAPLLREKNPLVTVECDDGLIITSFTSVFYQIVTNLISNSLFHAFEGRQVCKITMTVTIQGNSLEFHYQDDGLGMNAEQLHHIYEPFFTTRRLQGGTGLGMHIVFNLVTQTLGGTIQCQSEINRGVHFIISLPLSVVKAQASE